MTVNLDKLILGLTICGCDCLLSAEWKSDNKIVARSGPGKGKGDVIVTTRQGGVGTCNVSFKGMHNLYYYKRVFCIYTLYVAMSSD